MAIAVKWWHPSSWLSKMCLSKILCSGRITRYHENFLLVSTSYLGLFSWHERAKCASPPKSLFIISFSLNFIPYRSMNSRSFNSSTKMNFSRLLSLPNSTTALGPDVTIIQLHTEANSFARPRAAWSASISLRYAKSIWHYDIWNWNIVSYWLRIS